MRISDWSSAVCSSDLVPARLAVARKPDEPGDGGLGRGEDLRRPRRTEVVDQDAPRLAVGEPVERGGQRDDRHNIELEPKGRIAGGRTEERTCGNSCISEGEVMWAH